MMRVVVRMISVVVALALALPVFAQQRHPEHAGQGKGWAREVRDDRGPRGGGHLTPDERKALRRDIIQHGRDHYRGGPGQPPPPPPRRQ